VAAAGPFVLLRLREIKKVKRLFGMSVEPADGGCMACCIHTAQQMHDRVAYCGQHLEGRSSTRPAAVLTKRHVAHVVQVVLDLPVLTY